MPANKPAAAAARSLREEEEERRKQYNEKREMIELRAVFEKLDQDGDSVINFKDLNTMLVKLDFKVPRKDVEDMIWEVDELGDEAIDWDEFLLMFKRCRADKTGYEPRKLYNVVEFLLHDKDGGGTIDLDECMEILFRRYGKDQLEQRTNDFFKQSEGGTEITFTQL